MSEPPVCIAIDGPSASGKSTVARGVARALGYLYVDSGALYRGLTWAAVKSGTPTSNPHDVIALLSALRWDFRIEDATLRFRIDGEDPGDALRSEPVRERVSEVASIPEVRVFVVERLRDAARFGPLVMEGRDIGSVVFPDTPHKFYLDADPAVRARRRLRDIVQLEGRGDEGAVRSSLERRDTLDRSRATAPLQIALHAEVIDSTARSAEEVVAFIVARVRQGKAGL